MKLVDFGIVIVFVAAQWPGVTNYVHTHRLLQRVRQSDGSACGPAGSTAPADPHTTRFDNDQP